MNTKILSSSNSENAPHGLNRGISNNQYPNKQNG